MKIKSIKSYLLSISGLLVLIIIALFLPNIIFSIQDGYQTATVETGNREAFDVQTAEEAYPKDIATRMQRVAAARWGNMTVSVVEQNIDQDLFNTLMNEIMMQEYMKILLTLADYELTEALERVSIENVKICDRYVVYGDDYTEGILLTFWYVKIYLPTVESYVEFIVDSETYSIYYAELNAEDTVNYVVYADSEQTEGVQVSIISDVQENADKEEMTAEEKSELLSYMAVAIPSYYAEYYSPYYGVNPEELLYAKDYYDEMISITNEFVTTTYILPYDDDNSLLFRFYAEQGDGKILNVSIGLPLIRQLIQE